MSASISSVHDIAQLGEIKQMVDAYLESFCQQQIARAEVLSPAYGDLWRSIHANIMAGGKRLRPYLTLLAYSACGGDPNKDVLPAAVAWELLHACMLIHDDIIDRDYKRHGTDNVAGTYLSQYASTEDPHHYANSTSLLAGDLALSASYNAVMNSKLSPEDKTLVCHFLEEATFAVAGGELMDMQASLAEPDSVDTIAIAQYKTAEYSFYGPLTTGAMLAGASEEVEEMLCDFATSLGIAYQLVDDILGITGEENTIGKSTETDIVEGKRTEILVQTYRRIDKTTQDELTMLLAKGASLNHQEIDRVKVIMRSSGAIEAVQQLVNQYEQRVREVITRLGFDETHTAAMSAIVDAVLRRSS